MIEMDKNIKIHQTEYEKLIETIAFWTRIYRSNRAKVTWIGLVCPPRPAYGTGETLAKPLFFP